MARIVALTAVLVIAGCGAPVNPSASRPGTSPAATSQPSPAASSVPTSTKAVFALLAATPPAGRSPAITCNGRIGASDPVAVVGIEAGRPVLRDYADPAHPATVCDLGPARALQLIDAHHIVIAGGEGYAVVDLPQVSFHWFNLPVVGTGPLPQFLAVSPALDAVSWYAFDSAVNADQIHLSTAAGDRVVASLPSRGPGRCGSPEDSNQGGYSRSGGDQFVLTQDDPGEQALLVLVGDQTRLKLVPPAGSPWTANQRPAMAVWSPNSETLY